MSPGDSTGVNETMQCVFEDSEFYRLEGSIRFSKKCITYDIKEKQFEATSTNNAMIKHLSFPAAKIQSKRTTIHSSRRTSAQFLKDKENEGSRGPGFQLAVRRTFSMFDEDDKEREEATEEDTKEKENEEDEVCGACAETASTVRLVLGRKRDLMA